MSSTDEKYMRMAIDAAKNCKPEDDRIHPKVGAVVVKDSKVLASAYRGENQTGDHAEYIALDVKLRDEVLVDSTVYTTLEPCTQRTHPKLSCAKRIIDRKVKRVVIGMLDPNHEIRGKGILMLSEARIEVDLFPLALLMEVEEMNREFRRLFETSHGEIHDIQGFIETTRERSLDEWYRKLNSIYWAINYYRDPMSIFTHLVEVIGGLSILASHKKKPGVELQTYLPKTLAWWFTLCGKVGVESVSKMLWDKFPSACAYCVQSPHDPDECTTQKALRPGPDWERLRLIGEKNERKRPNSLSEWQVMFSKIYPVQQKDEFGPIFARLTEELGELAESIRVLSIMPGFFLSEAADVFAWLMHLQNLVELRDEVPKHKRGQEIANLLAIEYPDRCKECGALVCRCEPILERTIGRIAHDVPIGWGSFAPGGRFLTSAKAREIFSRNNI